MSRKKLIPISPGHAMPRDHPMYPPLWLTRATKDLQLPDSVSLLMCSVVLRAKSEGSKGFMRDT